MFEFELDYLISNKHVIHLAGYIILEKTYNSRKKYIFV